MPAGIAARAFVGLAECLHGRSCATLAGHGNAKPDVLTGANWLAACRKNALARASVQEYPRRRLRRAAHPETHT